MCVAAGNARGGAFGLLGGLCAQHTMVDFFFGDDMDFYRAAEQACFKVLGGQALPSLTSSTQIFSGAPAGTRMIVFVLRGNGITMRGDGGTPTAGANGVDYPAGGPYALAIDDNQALSFYAIQNGGAATGWVEFWGLP